MWRIVCDRPASHRSLTKCFQWQIAMRGSCIAGFWTQGFSTIYMGKPVASRFGLMVSRIQDQENSRMPFQMFRFLQEFSIETSNATRNWVNGKPHVAFFQFWEPAYARVKSSKRTIAPILCRKYFKTPSRKLVFINQTALIGGDLIRKYLAMQKFIQ